MKVCLVFYRTVALPLIGISLITAYQVWQAQSAYFVFRVLWVKLLTSIVIGIYVAIFRHNQFLFFSNLGITQARLLITSFVVDFCIWMLVMWVTLQWL